jgi:hypothetical protein
MTRPEFESLPLRAGDPKASAWGLYGEGDELGTLNLLGPDTVKQAIAEVKLGETISLR